MNNNKEHGPIEWMRWIPAMILAFLFLIAGFISIRIILLPLLCSLALAYLLAPVVNWFERRGWSRISSVLLSMTASAVILVLILIFVVPGVWGQLVKLYDRIQLLISDPAPLQHLLAQIERLSPQFYEFAKPRIDGLMHSINPERFLDIALSWMQSGLFRLVNLTTSLFDLMLIPFLVYYFLADYGAMHSRVERLIPPRYRAITSDLIGQVSNVLSSYVRSQLLIGLVMGLLYSLGLAILRVPLALTVGMLAGVLNFIPYLGTLSGITLSLLFLALDNAGLGRLLGVFGVFAVVQSIEGYYLTPKLIGGRLHLHPLWVLTGLLIGGNLFGLLGVILTVPLIAITKVLFRFFEDIYQQSDFYRRSNLNLLTDQGLPLPNSDTSSFTQDPSSQKRRTIITTGELESRINTHSTNE
ncbi:MAG: AI-2E family transporter [Blastocatellia bacterium]|nr:AI-2E family transporter [Blastocatellia bacterium]